MTPTAFRAALAALDWTQRGLADLLGIHPTTVRRWALGEARIPEQIAAWLETLAAFHRAHPVPRRTP